MGRLGGRLGTSADIVSATWSIKGTPPPVAAEYGLQCVRCTNVPRRATDMVTTPSGRVCRARPACDVRRAAAIREGVIETS